MTDVVLRWEHPFVIPDEFLLAGSLVDELLKKAKARPMEQMTADAVRKCRAHTGLGVVEYGIALGYQGNGNTISKVIRSFETGERVPNGLVQRLMLMYWRHGIPSEFMPPGREGRVVRPGLAE